MESKYPPHLWKFVTHAVRILDMRFVFQWIAWLSNIIFETDATIDLLFPTIFSYYVISYVGICLLSLYFDYTKGIKLVQTPLFSL